MFIPLILRSSVSGSGDHMQVHIHVRSAMDNSRIKGKLHIAEVIGLLGNINTNSIILNSV